MENKIDNIQIGDYTLKQWEEQMQAPPIPSTMSYDDAEGLGLISPEENQPQQENKFYETLDAVGIDHPDADKQYEKLGIGESWADAGKALFTEASHIIAPKSMELEYEARTKFGETVKYGYRYLMGTASLMYGGGLVNGIKALSNMGKAGKGIQAISKLLSGKDIIKTGAKASKLAKVGARAANAAIGGALAGAIADFNLYRPEEEEGHLADLFGQTDNALISYLQTDENDTDLDAKLKNVVEGLFIGAGVGNLVEFGAKPLVKRVLKNIKALKEGKEGAAEAVIKDQIQLDHFAKTADLVEEVKRIREEAAANNQDASQMLIDRLHPEDNIEAQKMLKVLDEGDEIFPHSDGTWDREVRTWDEAYKVTPEEFKKQLAARDEAAGGYAGDTAINYQDKAIRDTWVQRQWIDANTEFNFKNKQAVEKVVKNYQDKWNLKNKIEIEIRDGLLDKKTGLPIEGSTESRKNIGTVNQTLQNKIDKQKLKIQKLEDKITMAEGGNKEVADPLDNLKEELRIAKNELKELNKTAKGTNKLKNIVIRLDKNAKNPYATLRSELEHARDIAKGEVPNQAERHFSRYEGMNEGEVAPDYVYKKAAGKAKALAGQVDINKIIKNNEATTNKGYSFTEQPTDTFHGEGTRTTLFNKTGEELGYIEHSVDESGILHIEQVTNSSYGDAHYEIGVAEKLVDNIIAQHPEKNIQWDATTPQGMTFKANYLEKHPELKEKTTGISTQEELDQHMNNEYNSGGGIVDEGSNRNNRQQSLEGRVGENQTDGISKTGRNSKTKSNNGSVGDILPSNTSTNVGRKNTSTSPQVEQLKLDFSQAVETKQSTEEVVNSLVNGEIKPTTKGDIDALVNKVVQTEPDISGFNWKDVINNPDKYTEDIERIFTEEDASGLIDALAKGDFDTLEAIIKKELAAVKLMGELSKVIKNQGLDLIDDAKIVVMNSVHHLGEYIKGIKSGFGTGLEAQKGINEVLESYGASRLSSWTKEGIDVFTGKMVDALNDIINLNFTRGKKLTPQQVKQELANALFNDPEVHDFMAFLAQNKDIYEEFSSEIEKILNKQGTITKEEGKKALQRTLYLPEYRAKVKAAQLAPDEKSLLKTIKDWMDGNGGFTSYYVHNLLSGIGSVAKNIGSGIANTLYFPAKKILASYDVFLDGAEQSALRAEGWNTYKNMYVSMKESWALMKEAFVVGNGKLTDIGEQTLNIDGGKFRGFHELKPMDHYLKNPSQFWEGLQNFHSIMTRAMGATDEFMSQLNYRSIARAKALNEAALYAEKAGKLGDEAWINDEAQKIFEKKFDKYGKPTDVESLHEARTILYQNNLDGTMTAANGKKEKMRDTTFVMEMAQQVQQQANKNWFVKCMFPFVKTGANILQMALDHNIFYMYGSPQQRALLKSQTTEGALARSQCAFGAFSLCIGMMAAGMGFITGSAPSDPKERKALFATGWRPYSFKFGDTYVSYQGYEPIHGMLGFAADCANMWSTVTNPEDEKRVQHFQEQIMPTLVNNFLDKAAFRTGLKQLDLIMNAKDLDEWSRAMAQTVKGVLPDVAMVTNLRSAGKHDVMQPQTMYERVFYRYFPNLWQPKDYRRNVFGEKQSITGLVISSAGSQDGSPEEQALEYLAKYGYTPSEIDNVIANTGLKISNFKDPDTGRSAMDAMKEEMSTVTIQGMTLREAIRALVTSEEYQLLPDGVDLDTGTRWGAKEDTKINAVNSVFLMYKQRAKKNIMQNNEYFVDDQGRTMTEAKEDIHLKRLEYLNNLY